MANLKLRGFKELERATDKLAGDAATMSEGHRAVATILVPAVAMRTPTRTGALAMSWTAGSEDGAAQVSSPLPYAGPIEFGVPSRNIEAARMVRDTIEEQESTIVEGYERELERMAGKSGFDTK